MAKDRVVHYRPTFHERWGYGLPSEDAACGRPWRKVAWTYDRADVTANCCLRAKVWKQPIAPGSSA